MASRLNDSQKKALLEGYRTGQSTIRLANAYGCSQNTVIRTVRSFLTQDEYSSLKVARSKGNVVDEKELEVESNSPNSEGPSGAIPLAIDSTSIEESLEGNSNRKLNFQSHNLDKQSTNSLRLESFDKETQLEKEQELSSSDEFVSFDEFQEVVPLSSDLAEKEQKHLDFDPLPLSSLPSCVYMLVDRSIELDPKPLYEFSELGEIPEKDQDLKALSIFSSQRVAKRSCGRGQRVIKIPDTELFSISQRFLLAKGIKRLVLEGSLIALD